MADERRRDIREKIALGGLIVRAGLRGADRAYLLGALLEAAAVRAGSPEHDRIKAAGAMAFGKRPVNGAEMTQEDPPATPNADLTADE